ncbi:MAG: hypothetical protein H6643_16920 [Caldilineaceae bacterium]|nr:hypothetical protein [Caldilineaceae bacterium]
MFVVDERMSRMTAETYQEKILAGMDGLPDEVLAEIADYVYYLRRKVTMPDVYAAEVHRGMLQYTLRGGRQDSLTHLEEEFADYDQQFPRDQPDR